MEPITRKEMYLAKISGDYSGAVPKPVTRLDYYMAYAAGAYSGPLPRPIVQQEFYWAYICGNTNIRLPEPVTRVDIYLGSICGGMILLPEPITREEIYLSKIAKQSETVIKTTAGKTIVLTDSMDVPFEDFKVYGHTTQDGIPTPENPVELVSAGDKGSIEVDVLGGNLAYAIGRGNINNDGSVVTDVNGIRNIYAARVYPGMSITISNNIVLGWYSELPANGTPSIDRTRYIGKYGTMTVPDGAFYVACGLNDDTPDLVINVGSTALPWEPYKPKQTLIHTTPNGLTGIPVSSGGNYTDENGQQWIADYRDWERGVDVQMVGETDLTGATWAQNEAYKYYTRVDNNKYKSATLILCTKSLSIDLGISDNTMFINSLGIIRINWVNEVDTVEYVAEKMNGAILYGILATPIETPIPAEELVAYRALHTNTPTTTIMNDEDCWMEVGYRAKPISIYRMT